MSFQSGVRRVLTGHRTTGQPPVNRATAGQPDDRPVSRTTGQSGVRRVLTGHRTTGQPPVNRATAGQPEDRPISRTTGQPGNRQTGQPGNRAGTRSTSRLPGLPFPPEGSLRELQDSHVMFPGKVPKPGFQVRFPSKVSKRASLEEVDWTRTQVTLRVVPTHGSEGRFPSKVPKPASQSTSHNQVPRCWWGPDVYLRFDHQYKC